MLRDSRETMISRNTECVVCAWQQSEREKYRRIPIVSVSRKYPTLNNVGRDNKLNFIENKFTGLCAYIMFVPLSVDIRCAVYVILC